MCALLISLVTLLRFSLNFAHTDSTLFVFALFCSTLRCRINLLIVLLNQGISAGRILTSLLGIGLVAQSEIIMVVMFVAMLSKSVEFKYMNIFPFYFICNSNLNSTKFARS